MEKIRVSEASGPVLDWLVGVVNNTPNLHLVAKPGKLCVYGALPMPSGELLDWPFQPSTDWAQGGPIIEREGINTFKYNKLDESETDKWCGHKIVKRTDWRGDSLSVAVAMDGPTPLIAAMRCYVTSKLGEEIEVPDELLN